MMQAVAQFVAGAFDRLTKAQTMTAILVVAIIYLAITVAAGSNVTAPSLLQRANVVSPDSQITQLHNELKLFRVEVNMKLDATGARLDRIEDRVDRRVDATARIKNESGAI